ncbi:MAG: hypothetical protein AAFV07_04425, partial [Bacteroidota bacterium]
QLSTRQNGVPVEAVQQGLIDLGYTLPRYMADGRFGGETEQVSGVFRQDRGMEGDAMDSAALGHLDAEAPEQGQQTERTFDYGRLLEDNQLDFAIGIGFDEGKTHTGAEEELRGYLSGEGFSETQSGTPGITRFSKETFVFDPGIGIYRYVTINLTMITPAVGASDAFMQALNDSEVAMYSGHARGGLGPDFDDKHDADEQLVWGRSSDLHNRRDSTVRTPRDNYYRTVTGGRDNDLEELRDEGFWETDRYRVWFFDACTSLNYLDELRGGLLPDDMTRGNTDFIGTRESVPAATSGRQMINFIESILNAESVNQLVGRLNQTNDEQLDDWIEDYPREARSLNEMRTPYFAEGQGDNPVANQSM